MELQISPADQEFHLKLYMTFSITECQISAANQERDLNLHIAPPIIQRLLKGMS